MMCGAFANQYEALADKEHLKAGLDEESAEHPQAVITQVFEWHLEDVTPANTAQVNLLRGPICSTTHSQELGEREGDIMSLSQSVYTVWLSFSGK